MKHPAARARCEEFWELCSKLEGVAAWSEAVLLLDQYVELLLKSSGRRNLIAESQRNADALWEHIFESIQALRLVQEFAAASVLDAGSGNGLPGVPLAIALPNVCFTLVDRASRKAEFLELITASCGLRNVAVHAGELDVGLIDTIAPQMVLMRAVVSADSDSLPQWLSELRCAWLVFATQANRDNWLRLATTAGFQLEREKEYELASDDRRRSLLKFIRF